MVESSVKTISRPVINRLPVDVNQLDEFACRQLDRVCHVVRPWRLESCTRDFAVEFFTPLLPLQIFSCPDCIFVESCFHMGKLWLLIMDLPALFLTWLFFFCYLLSNHIFILSIIARSLSPSVRQ